MDWIPFFIAILLLIILVNVNIKEGFSVNLTSDIIENYERDLIKKLNIFRESYLNDFDNNITSTLNRNYDNINDSSSNQIKFDNYVYKYRTLDPSFVFINDLTMNIKYTSIYESKSYKALQHCLIICQNIINIVGTKIDENTSLTDDVNEYKILLICIKILDDINDQYKKFVNVFNTSFTDISGLNLLEYHETIIQIIRTIEYQTPILFMLCIPYFEFNRMNLIKNEIINDPIRKQQSEEYLSSEQYIQDKQKFDFLSNIKIKDITNFGPIIDMLKNQNPNYETNMNEYTNSFNDLFEGRFPNRSINQDQYNNRIQIDNGNQFNNLGNQLNNDNQNVGNQFNNLGNFGNVNQGN